PTATYHRNTLTYLLRQRYGDPAPHIAHRLDRETSGIVLCGRHLEAERAPKRAFENRETDKTYLAIVEGELTDDRGTIDLPLAAVDDPGGGDPRGAGRSRRRDPYCRARERALHVLMEVSEGGAPAVSPFEVHARRGGRTLVALRPETGRQHQLRVHMAALGHPVVGDKLYGPGGPDVFLEYIETGMTDALAARAGHVRQALHAHALTLAHPASGEPLTLRSDLPQDLRALWAGEVPGIDSGGIRG
ncbi:MAG: RluA family pseudouridine synthase, partial [Polyangiales bacterium]